MTDDLVTIVTRSIDIDATTDRVWAALTDPASFSRWYAFGGAEIEPFEGGAMRVWWDEHGSYLGRVERWDPLLSFGYRLAVVNDIEPTAGNCTHVAFTLEALPHGTRLTVVEHGWDDLDSEHATDPDLPRLAGEGWEGGFAMLEQVLAEAGDHPDR